MASVMTSTAREHSSFGYLDVWGLGVYSRHRERGDKDYYNYHSQLFIQSTKLVARAGSPRSVFNSASSSPLYGEHLVQLGFSSALCSAKNEILIGCRLDANHIGSKLFQLQSQALQKCSALEESSTAPIETGLGSNNKNVENSALVTEKQTSSVTPLRKRVSKKRVSGSSLISQEQEKARSHTLNGSVKFIDKYEYLKVVQLIEGMNISGSAHAKCLKCASFTTGANVISVISILSKIGLNKDEIGLVFSKLPSLLKRDAVQLMKVFHLLLELGGRKEELCGVCIQYPALLECNSDQIQKVIVFLQSVGLTKEEVLSVLHTKPQVLRYPEYQVKLSVNCLLKLGVPKEDLCRILKKVSRLFSPVIQENLQIRLKFLVRIGIEPRVLGKTIARRPSMLSFNLEGMTRSYKYIGQLPRRNDGTKIITGFADVLVLDRKKKREPIVDYLLSLGVKPDCLGKVLLKSPQLLGYRIEALEEKIKYLRTLGVKEEALGKVITRAPQVICLNYEEKLKPVVEFLQSAGLDQDQDIEMVLSRNAQILCSDIEKNLRPKFEFFYTVGLEKKEVARMFVLFPTMFGLSIESSLRPKYNYLINVMKRSVKEIVSFPQYFGCSLEKRIKPRYEQLTRRGIHTTLSSMLSYNDEDFKSRYMNDKCDNQMKTAESLSSYTNLNVFSAYI